MKHMEEMPKLRAKVFGQVGGIAEMWQEQKGIDGI
jgi:hypothetical protein